MDKLASEAKPLEEVLFHNPRSVSINADPDDNTFIEYVVTPNNNLVEDTLGNFAGYNLTEKLLTSFHKKSSEITPSLNSFQYNNRKNQPNFLN